MRVYAIMVSLSKKRNEMTKETRNNKNNNNKYHTQTMRISHLSQRKPFTTLSNEANVLFDTIRQTPHEYFCRGSFLSYRLHKFLHSFIQFVEILAHMTYFQTPSQRLVTVIDFFRQGIKWKKKATRWNHRSHARFHYKISSVVSRCRVFSV